VFSSEILISEGYNSGIEIPKTEYSPFKEAIVGTKTVINETEVLSKDKEETGLKQDTSLEIASIKKLDSEEKINTDGIKNKSESEKIIKNKIVRKKKNKEDKVMDVEEGDVEENKVLKNIISTRKVNNNINYKVQILAGHRIISNKQVSNQYKYNGEYSLETHNGWIKYTVGSNSKYSNARDSRNDLKNYNFPGPFVTAYNYGERISVQEALILTSQNWVP
jgi:hypothetical protein